MDAQHLKQALDLKLDSPPGALKPTDWKHRLRSPTVVLGVSVGALVFLGLGISLFSSTPQTEVYEAEPENQLDKSAIVAGAEDSHSNTVFQSTEQLSAFREQLLIRFRF